MNLCASLQIVVYSNIQNTALDFFKTKLTFLDFLIIGLGIFLIFYQIIKRLFTRSRSFYNKAKKDSLYLKKAEVKIGYIGGLIELLPIMGILGTVLGLMKGLYVISSKELPTIKDIATQIAPALSTTFFGLLFAVINLFLFNILQSYFEELISWCQQNIPENIGNKNERA